MEQHDFDKLVESEESALRYLMQRRFPHNRLVCPMCDSTRIYRLSNARLRCVPDKYTFGPLTGTWLGETKVGPARLLRLVRAYADGHTVLHAARGAGVSHATARRIYATIWRAIHAHQRAIPAEAKCNAAREKST